MKRKLVAYALIGAVTVSMFTGGGSIFADSNMKGSEKKEVQVNEMKEDKMNEDMMEEQMKHSGKHNLFQGKLMEIKKHKDFYRIDVKQEDEEMLANIDSETIIIDQRTKSSTTIDKLQTESEIVIVYDIDTPIAMSLPPIVSKVKAIIIKDKNAMADIGVLNEKLNDVDNKFSTTLDDKLSVLNLTDMKKKLEKEALKDSEVLIVYKRSTLSLPPTHNVEMAILLSTKEELEKFKKENEKLNEKDIIPYKEENETKKESTYVPLRKHAEEKGYKVEWLANDKPIILSKNDIKIEILLNSKEFKYYHMTMDLQPLDNVKEMDLTPMLEKSTTIVSSSFIEMLK